MSSVEEITMDRLKLLEATYDDLFPTTLTCMQEALLKDILSLEIHRLHQMRREQIDAACEKENRLCAMHEYYGRRGDGYQMGREESKAYSMADWSSWCSREQLYLAGVTDGKKQADISAKSAVDKITIYRLEKENHSLKKDMVSLKTELGHANNYLEELKSRNENLHDGIRRRERRIDDLRQHLDALNDENEKLKLSANWNEAITDSLRNQNSELISQNHELKLQAKEDASKMLADGKRITTLERDIEAANEVVRILTKNFPDRCDELKARLTLPELENISDALAGLNVMVSRYIRDNPDVAIGSRLLIKMNDAFNDTDRVITSMKSKFKTNV